MDIENRINKARAAFGMLSVVWQNNNFSSSLKLRLYKSNVVSSATWLLYMEGSKSCHIETASFHKSLPKEYFPYLLAKSYYKWGTAPKSRNGWNPFDGLGRAPGEHCQTWRRAVERETKTLGKSWRELKLIARNRIRWRAGIVDALCPRED